MNIRPHVSRVPFRIRRNWSSSGSSDRTGERGTAILEFSIIVPFLVFLVLALVDFGHLLIDYMIFSQIAREGVRVLSASPDLWQGRENITKTSWDGSFSVRRAQCEQSPPMPSAHCGHFDAQFRMNELMQMYISNRSNPQHRMASPNLRLTRVETEFVPIGGTPPADEDTVAVRLTFDFGGAMLFNFDDLIIEHRGPYLFELTAPAGP